MLIQYKGVTAYVCSHHQCLLMGYIKKLSSYRNAPLVSVMFSVSYDKTYEHGQLFRDYTIRGLAYTLHGERVVIPPVPRPSH